MDLCWGSNRVLESEARIVGSNCGLESGARVRAKTVAFLGGKNSEFCEFAQNSQTRGNVT